MYYSYLPDDYLQRFFLLCPYYCLNLVFVINFLVFSFSEFLLATVTANTKSRATSIVRIPEFNYYYYYLNPITITITGVGISGDARRRQ